MTSKQENPHQLVLALLDSRESVVAQDVRVLLGSTAADAQIGLEELISQGLVRTEPVRSSTRYSKREFEHDRELVQEVWFAKLEGWFGLGKTETAPGIARLLGLDLAQVRATLEEMCQRGVLYGKFVGQMCIYSLRERGETLQASDEQMHALHNTPEKLQQQAFLDAGNAPGINRKR